MLLNGAVCACGSDICCLIGVPASCTLDVSHVITDVAETLRLFHQPRKRATGRPACHTHTHPRARARTHTSTARGGDRLTEPQTYLLFLWPIILAL